MAQTLTDAQIALIKTIGNTRVVYTTLTTDELDALDTLIALRLVRKVRGAGVSVLCYELGISGLRVWEDMQAAETPVSAEYPEYVPSEGVECGPNGIEELEATPAELDTSYTPRVAERLMMDFIAENDITATQDELVEYAANQGYRADGQHLVNAFINFGGTLEELETTPAPINFNSPEFIERLARLNGYPEYKYTEGDCTCGGGYNEYGHCVCKKPAPIDPRDTRIAELEAQIATIHTAFQPAHVLTRSLAFTEQKWAVLLEGLYAAVAKTMPVESQS